MLDSLVERWHLAMLDLLDGIHRCQPDQMPQLVTAAAEQVSPGVTIYLVDYEQQTLRPLADPATSAVPLPVDGSIAGRAYRLGEVQAEPGVGVTGVLTRLWVPLLDGTERLGVLEILATDDLTTVVPAGYKPHVSFANLVGHLIAAKLPYGDSLQRARRSRPMSVASELLRQLLPPSTFTTDRLVVAASLQPPYAIGGDAFDYAVDGDIAYLAIFDGQGHGLEAGLSTAVALAATRAARREGDGIYLMAQSADGHLSAHFNEGFVTAILAQLDLNTGLLRFLNAGHPPPLLLHGTDNARTLEGGQRPPLGIAGTAVGLGEQRIAPGDRLLLYTDGITESRDRDGRFFELDRLIQLASRYADSRLSPPETARRITQAVLDYCDGSPDDDATIMLVEWSTGAVERTLP